MVELLVVLAVIAVLASVAAPRYLRHLAHAQDVALRQSLAVMREAIDHFQADRGRYPEALQELVVHRYLRAVPVDPVTERSDTWVLLPPPAPQPGRVADVRSGAEGQANDGTFYATW